MDRPRAAADHQPDSLVEHAAADLLAIPEQWRHGFDLVVESMNVQASPDPPGDAAIAGVASLVAPGGTLLVIAAGHDGPAADRDALATPPCPLLREEVESVARDGLEMGSLERVITPADPDVPRWRAILRQPTTPQHAGSSLRAAPPSVLPPRRTEDGLPPTMT